MQDDQDGTSRSTAAKSETRNPKFDDFEFRIRRLSLQHLVASPAALLMDANLLVALGTAPESASFHFLFSRSKRHERKLLFSSCAFSKSQGAMIDKGLRAGNKSLAYRGTSTSGRSMDSPPAIVAIASNTLGSMVSEKERPDPSANTMFVSIGPLDTTLLR
jgi:hypothetical protein